mmetsp:Transcript_3497/g.12330  ORF Transcript_3497/g.12330 Transcript_3497/m.12330 type:complete len:137 (+) Transcript_3497:878-1288(+)
MTNDFCSRYAAWPERYFVIDQDGRLQHISSPSDELGFNRLALRRFLRSVVQQCGDGCDTVTDLLSSGGVPVDSAAVDDDNAVDVSEVSLADQEDTIALLVSKGLVTGPAEVRADCKAEADVPCDTAEPAFVPRISA